MTLKKQILVNFKPKGKKENTYCIGVIYFWQMTAFLALFYIDY